VNRFILASSSPRRIQLLRDSKFDPDIICPEVTELDCDFLTPSEIAMFNAYRKAVTVANRYPEAVVLAADTVVALGWETFGKPKDHEDARWMLQNLVGKTHDVITGVALVTPARPIILEEEQSAVKFRLLSNAEIEVYLNTIYPFDKAGGYAAQDSPDAVIEYVNGSFTNVVGLPMELVLPLLASAGIHPAASC
jgi:septum formation protein